ncbi:MAG: RNA polymerase sigma factor [Bacteroidales bacterium]|nr:RNA polymerase sigma factor [Candidatus Cryptobacteroides fimicaballi]
MEKTGSKPIDELVRLAMAGDGTAFTQLWDTHIVALRSYIKSTFRNLDDFYIDDICSHSFEKAFRRIGSYDPSLSRFSTWLKSIAHNSALDMLEQESRERRRYTYLDDEREHLSVIDSVPDELDTPLDSIIRSEDEQRIRICIEGLPELYREIASKRLVEGMQYKEIAEETGLELNTVRTRIRRAKALIDKMKEDNGV